MSVTFGLNLDLNNGLATRLLRAIGYTVKGSEGGWPVQKMLDGIAAAEVAEEDAQFLEWLRQEVLDAQADGEAIFRWS